MPDTTIPGSPSPPGTAIECAYCGSPLADDDKIFHCPACSTPYHQECWSFNNSSCSRYGCLGKSSLPAPVQSRAKTTLTIDADDISVIDRLPARRQVTSEVKGVWRSLPSSLAASGALGLLLFGLYSGAIAALRWSMGEEIFSQVFALPQLARLGSLSWWWLWLLLAVAYGALHRRYLFGASLKLYPVVRCILFMPYQVAAMYLSGYLAFAISYRWPDIIWSLSSKLTWLAPWIAGSLALLAVIAVLGAARSRDSSFPMAAAPILVVLLALPGYAAAILFGLVGSGIAWFAGGVVDLVSAAEGLRSLWFLTGLKLGGIYGFVFGVVFVPTLLAKR